MSPETGAVLAEPPAFSLEPPRFGSNGKGTLRSAGVSVLRRIELREMGAENFSSGVPLETLRSRVPANHMASHAVLESISGVNHMGFLERSGHYNSRTIDFIAARCGRTKAG
jgi:hypothetical protein